MITPPLKLGWCLGRSGHLVVPRAPCCATGCAGLLPTEVLPILTSTTHSLSCMTASIANKKGICTFCVPGGHLAGGHWGLSDC